MHQQDARVYGMLERTRMTERRMEKERSKRGDYKRWLGDGHPSANGVSGGKRADMV
jgi:hypothetical protein